MFLFCIHSSLADFREISKGLTIIIHSFKKINKVLGDNGFDSVKTWDALRTMATLFNK